MSNPAQPSFVWQLYHHDLDPTAAMFATRLAGEPVHIQMTPDGSVQVVNATPRAFSGRLRIDGYGIDGRFSPPAGPMPDPTIVFGASAATPFTSAAPPPPITRLRLLDEKGRTVSENVYWPEDATFLDRLPKVTLTGSYRGGKVTLRNPTPNVALLVHLSLRDERGKRVLPAFYSDNFVHLFPGESKTITVEGKGGTRVFVDGYNLSGVAGKGLVYNEDARPEGTALAVP